MKNWNNANVDCKKKVPGGHLARVNSASENNYIKGHLNQDTWIDLNDRSREGYFRHTDGSRATFTDWAGGEPSGDSWWKLWRKEDCVQYNKEQNLKWNDEHCGDEYRYVCQFRAELVTPL